MNKSFSTKDRVFISLVGSSREGQNLLRIGSKLEFTKTWQKLVFYQHSHPFYDIMQKEIESLVQNTCYSLTIPVKRFSI